MIGRRSATLALIGRVARVREAQAQQQLAQAVMRERAQRTQVDAAQVRRDGALAALSGVHAKRRLDLARLALLHELAEHTETALLKESAMLDGHRESCQCDAEALVRRTRYRECAEDRLHARVEEERMQREERQKEVAVEAWLLTRKGRA